MDHIEYSVYDDLKAEAISITSLKKPKIINYRTKMHVLFVLINELKNTK